MNKLYYTQDKISSFFRPIFNNVYKLSDPNLNNLVSIITAMIDSESVVIADIARKFKGNRHSIQLTSHERRIMRFFTSFSSDAYALYQSLITHIISNYKTKHTDKKVHISLDHMFVKNKYTILLFSLRIGKQGIPLWFRCFESKHNPDAYKLDLIKQGIEFCKNLFPDDYHVIFLADRWFHYTEILSCIQNIGAFFCIRVKASLKFSYYDKYGLLQTKHLRDFHPWSHSARHLKNVFFTHKNFKTNIVVAKTVDSGDPWYLVTNDSPNQAVKNYSYRFGSIESIFKNQKSNRI